MARFRFNISMSLDGYVAGPNQSVQDPLGIGGERLHEWVIPTASFRRMHGQEGGETGPNSTLLDEVFTNVGAHVMGRNMFGGHPGGWDMKKPWTGWWGKNPPYHNPVFVLTHHAREPLVMEGGTVFNFVTDGIESALDQARRAARGKDVALGGGAKAAQQYLAAGLIDDMLISLVPILLGGGERLFEHVGDDLHGLKLVQTLPMPNVVHLKFAR